MQKCLLYAGFYNLLWGAWVGLFPNQLFDIIDIPRPNYIGIWQCIGMFVAVFGIGYIIAATDPLRHWPIVLVGFLGKTLGPIGFFYHAITNQIPWSFGVTIPTNDLIWAPFFFLILVHVYRSQFKITHNEASESDFLALKSNKGNDIGSLIKEKDCLFILPRHIGCSFSTAYLEQLSKDIPYLHEGKIKPVLILMEHEKDVKEILSSYELEDIEVIYDTQYISHMFLKMPPGTFTQLFGPREFITAAKLFLQGHNVRLNRANPFVLSGAALFISGKLVYTYISKRASDIPNLSGIIRNNLKERV